MSVQLKEDDDTKIVKCIVLTTKLDSELKRITETYPHLSQSQIVRQILREYFEHIQSHESNSF